MHIMIAVLLVVFAPLMTNAQLREGQHYAVVVPSGFVTHEGTSYGSSNPIFGVDLAQAPSGWLPSVFRAMRFEKNNGREVEFRKPGTWLKLRFPTDGERQEIERYAVPDGDDQANMLRDAVLDAAGAWAFGETNVPQDLWRALTIYALELGGEVLDRPTSFRGGTYMTVSLGTWGSVYNTRRINQAQRTALVVGDLLDRVKGAGALADVGLAGLHLRVTVPYGDLAVSSGYGADVLEWYIPSAVIPELIDFEITSQDFVDRSVVVTDGTRVEVDLSDQG